jgi:hypothetical protein
MSTGIVALMLVVLSVAAADTAAAQTVTAFKTGEVTTGMTKQCFYNALGSAHTLTISSTQLCPLTIQVPATPTQNPSTDSTPRPPRPSTVTAFKTGEVTTGMTKQCFYDALGNSYTRTISSVALCPLTIQVRLGP